MNSLSGSVKEPLFIGKVMACHFVRTLTLIRTLAWLLAGFLVDAREVACFAEQLRHKLGPSHI